MQRQLLSFSTRPHGNHRRGAFTLIELLIVIVIIAILLSLLLPAIFSIQRSARVAQVVVDIKNLEKAIADFKLKYGVEPPSSFRLREDGAYGTNSLDRNSLAIMRQIWPNFDPVTVLQANPIDFNGDGDTDGGFINLNGAECLVFFLGGPGVLGPSGTARAANGFSVNPSNPFLSGGSRVGPFYDFDPARLVDINSNAAPELIDTLPGQTMPYQYFSSYEGRGYQIDGYNGTQNDGDDEVIRLNGEVTMSSVYLTNDGNWDSDPVARPSAGAAWNSRSFQIISPGFDGLYGIGGAFTSDQGLAIKRGEDDEFRSRAARQPELDNITNFSSGTLDQFFTP